ncbi:hypothetical protein [Leptothrix discophora]|uniref:Uncharacterized protein n=1 Tax=Leptothrix discophora TaxID=89 RepID=A0ABT9G666_LEPDI|nr:hypothetical protein [Leptothrix discophora]MDP4301979.1 hypothetical protein [Leptothrix discophora]
MTAPLDLVRFTDTATAQATADELVLAKGTPVQLAEGVTLHAGYRQGVPTFVVKVAGADDLSAVITTEPLDA